MAFQSLPSKWQIEFTRAGLELSFQLSSSTADTRVGTLIDQCSIGCFPFLREHPLDFVYLQNLDCLPRSRTYDIAIAQAIHSVCARLNRLSQRLSPDRGRTRVASRFNSNRNGVQTPPGLSEPGPARSEASLSWWQHSGKESFGLRRLLPTPRALTGASPNWCADKSPLQRHRYDEWIAACRKPRTTGPSENLGYRQMPLRLSV